MDDVQHLRDSVEATRSQLKALQRCARVLGQFLADLEEQLDAVTAQPKEGTANGSSNGHQTAPGRIRIGA